MALALMPVRFYVIIRLPVWFTLCCPGRLCRRFLLSLDKSRQIEHENYSVCWFYFQSVNLAAYNYAAKNYFYPVPAKSCLTLSSLLGVIDPIGQKSDIFAPGFYHVCIAGLVMGIAVLFKTRRIGIIILFAAALFAAFYKQMLNVPPAVWGVDSCFDLFDLIASALKLLFSPARAIPNGGDYRGSY
jgi:hypothetical protein